MTPQSVYGQSIPSYSGISTCTLPGNTMLESALMAQSAGLGFPAGQVPPIPLSTYQAMVPPASLPQVCLLNITHMQMQQRYI